MGTNILVSCWPASGKYFCFHQLLVQEGEAGKKEGQEEADVAQENNTSLEMKFCNEVVDEPDFEVETGNHSQGPAEGTPKTGNT